MVRDLSLCIVMCWLGIVVVCRCLLFVVVGCFVLSSLLFVVWCLVVVVCGLRIEARCLLFDAIVVC